MAKRSDRLKVLIFKGKLEPFLKLSKCNICAENILVKVEKNDEHSYPKKPLTSQQSSAMLKFVK